MWASTKTVKKKARVRARIPMDPYIMVCTLAASRVDMALALGKMGMFIRAHMPMTGCMVAGHFGGHLGIFTPENLQMIDGTVKVR
jgi:hypothetical protein